MASPPNGRPDDELESTIRRCVREEMRSLRGGAQSLMDRTRHLIQEASTSVAREIETNMNVAGVNSVPNGGKRKLPGHPFRPSVFGSRKRKKGVKEQPSIPKSVHLIDCLEKESDDEDTDEERDSFSFSERHIVIKGEFDLTPGHSEDEIRNELVEVFKSKIPTIRKADLDFVKREKNVVTLPVVKAGHKWDFAHVKNLCGQGRLYVKLNVSKDELLNRGNSDDELSKPVFLHTERALLIEGNDASVESDQNSVPQRIRQCGRHMDGREQISSTASDGFISIPGPSHARPLLHANNASPGPSSSWQFQLEASQIESLRAIFPHLSENDARSALTNYGSVDRAADALSANEPNEGAQESSPVIAVEDNPTSASDILAELRKQMQYPPQKVNVDREDLLADALCYYKNPDFDPKKRIRVCSKDQVALDTGGVLRQFYSDVFVALSQNGDHMKLFEGEAKRRLPLFRSEHVVSGIFEILGKMVAHSLVQGGPGFPYLAPVVYSYISTGDLQAALLHVSAVDVCDPILSTIIERVRL
ncbi:uncharacterized protein [Montipora capricornis]|uniref:uncharacterized protein n=1 Tax=Montipora capricornis TaxID=246305 RepID=UPI0035F12B55